MKFLLKLILFPVWILVKLIALIGNLLTHCACFAFNLLFICIAISVVMSIAQGLWTTLFILLGMGIAASLVSLVFAFVATEFWVMLSDGLKKFIFS